MGGIRGSGDGHFGGHMLTILLAGVVTLTVLSLMIQVATGKVDTLGDLGEEAVRLLIVSFIIIPTMCGLALLWIWALKS